MKKIFGFIIALLAVVGIGTGTVYANPSFFGSHAATAAATTTTGVLRYGISTTTLAITYNTNSNNHKIDQALVVFQAEASSTQNSVINVQVQYSNDNIDWYSRTEATTTFSQMVEKTYSFTIATSSDQVSSTTGALWRVHKSLLIDTPTPYVRVRFSVPSGGSQVGVWADYTPIKEQY